MRGITVNTATYICMAAATLAIVAISLFCYFVFFAETLIVWGIICSFIGGCLFLGTTVGMMCYIIRKR